MSNYYNLNYEPFLPKDLNAAIIDIGCGDGELVRFMHGLGYRDIAAIDKDTAALQSVGDLDGVTRIEALADASLFYGLDRLFDLIVMKQIIYYLDRSAVVPFLHSAREHLSDGGTLIMEVFNGGLLFGLYTEVKDSEIRTAYSEHSLRRLLERNGFVVRELFGFRQGPATTLKSRMYRILKWLSFRAWRARLILERGRDDELPRIFEKTIIAIAEKKRG